MSRNPGPASQLGGGGCGTQPPQDQLTQPNAADARARADGAVERITGSARGQFNFYGPSPEPGSILRLWDFADADRIVMVSKNLNPDNRIRTGRPLH